MKVLQGPYKGFADEVLLEFNHGRFLPPWKARFGVWGVDLETLI